MRRRGERILEDFAVGQQTQRTRDGLAAGGRRSVVKPGDSQASHNRAQRRGVGGPKRTAVWYGGSGGGTSTVGYPQEQGKEEVLESSVSPKARLFSACWGTTCLDKETGVSSSDCRSRVKVGKGKEESVEREDPLAERAGTKRAVLAVTRSLFSNHRQPDIRYYSRV
jgi:hypothetical protein